VVTERLYDGASRITLENGLRILAEEVTTSRSVSLGIWVRAGSRDDPDRRPGLTHFLEHLLFKGTTSRDAIAISRAIDGVGGHLNGATGKEITFFYADVPADGVLVALDVLADLVQHPAFGREELERERGVVLEELRGHDDDPEQYAHDLFAAGLWEDGHPLSRPVLGERRTIEETTADELAAHHRRLYQPRNLVLVACGAVRAGPVVEAAARLFDTGSDSFTLSPRNPPRMRSGRSVHDRDTGQTHLYLGLPGIRACDPGRLALEVLDAVLGEGPGSRLFRLIREERGLAYTVSSFSTYHSDAGCFTIYAGVAPENLEETRDVILAELAHLRDEGASCEELALAKAKLRGTLILSLESNSDRMGRLGSAAIIEREILSPEDLIARVEAIGQEDVARAIERSIRLDSLNLAAIGPRPSRAGSSGPST
jgi:predicted Zn-dependent peptidase